MDFEIEVLKHPTEEDWRLCRTCALTTVLSLDPKGGYDGDDVPFEWKQRILRANHSPIRTLQFCFRLIGIPYWVSVHLCRHIHATPFVSSQRDDRQHKYKRGEAPQNAPVNMCWYMNAEELITIAHKRLCYKASPETREIVQAICREVERVNPEFKGLLVPNCIYRGGICTEMVSCGYNKNISTEDSD